MGVKSPSSSDVSYSLSPRGSKRPRLSPESCEKDASSFLKNSNNIQGLSGKKKISQCTSFRNISACSRCRARKNRCDQHLPSCANCEKNGERCVGYDPITKKEIPRSYVFYLENRVTYLENLLHERNIDFAPANVLDHSSYTTHLDSSSSLVQKALKKKLTSSPSRSNPNFYEQTPEPFTSIQNISGPGKLGRQIFEVDSYSAINRQGHLESRDMQIKSGISFARVVFAAIKSSVSGPSNDKNSSKQPPTAPKPASNSIRDSFFGLHNKCTSEQACFPSKDIGYCLVNHYFEYANPQLPILHRGEFMKMFESVYSISNAMDRTPKELYMLNIVFATGAGILLGDCGGKEKGKEKEKEEYCHKIDDNQRSQPEEYHAAAIVHLESCLDTSSGLSCNDCFGGGLEQLQAVLLLAGFALLRPVPPGLWYIIGAAVRLAVDLGLHNEDGKSLDTSFDNVLNVFRKEDQSLPQMQDDERNLSEHSRREWVRDFRRRLWWCTYSFDRLVSTCVGRPVGITDQVITTEFPSLLDDLHITPAGFVTPPHQFTPSYKHISCHYFRLRILQSEILQVLQYRQAIRARTVRAGHRDNCKTSSPPSSFLSAHSNNFGAWREDIDRRLWEWKTSVPSQKTIGVAFVIEYLDLNYWQCILMLYRQSLGVPQVFAEMFGTTDGVEPLSKRTGDGRSKEEEESIFLKIAEAGQTVLSLYRQLSCMHLVNYNYLATHNIIMAGISFLFAIWHSVAVRSRLTVDEVNTTILAATLVLDRLIEKCPPADACRDALERMSKATVKMCLSTTGFGSSVSGLDSRLKTQGPAPVLAKVSDDANKSDMKTEMVVSTEDTESNVMYLKNTLRNPLGNINLRNPKFDYDSTSTQEVQSYKFRRLQSSDTSFIVSQNTRHNFKTPDSIPNQNIYPRSMNTLSECDQSSSHSDLNSLLDPSFSNSYLHRNSQEYGYTQPDSSYNSPNIQLKYGSPNPEECSIKGTTWSADLDLGASHYDDESSLNYEIDVNDIESLISKHDLNQTGSVSDLFEGFFGAGSGVC